MSILIRYITFLCVLSFCSCAVIFTGKQKVLMIPKSKAVTISVSKSSGISETKSNVNTEGKTFEVSNLTDNYLITQSKIGYRTKSTPIGRTKFNPVKIIDLGVPLACDMYLLTGNTSSIKAPAFYVGILGWLAIFNGPWRLYEKTYTLPALIQLPKRDSTEMYLMMDKVSMNAPKDSLVSIFYESYSKFQSGDQLYKSNSTDDIHFDNMIFMDSLNHTLKKFGYTDTLKKFLGNSFNVYKINCEISNLSQYSIGSFYTLEIHSKWKLMDALNEKEIFSRYINAKSNYTFYEVGKKTIVEKHIEDALEVSLMKFLNNPEVKNKLSSQEFSSANIEKGWDTLTLESHDKFASGIAGATKSVVTVKTKNGYGSGCVITPDGYIVTCYHVVGGVNDDIEVITEGDKKLKAKIVRSNPIYDLALIKVEGMTFEPLRLQSSKSFDVGTEVYAIGTPGDLELGQTLTKGIISGKRKVDNKLYIQTDVSINRGNSGGALIDKTGILLGIVNAKIVGFGIEGIGFAIPINYLEEAFKIKIK